VYYFRKIFFETGHVMHLRDGSEAPVLTFFLKTTAYKKRRSFTYIVFQKCPQMLSQISTNDLYVTEKNEPPEKFFHRELEKNLPVALIAIYGGVTRCQNISPGWDSLLSESQY
jgi:hypothetical protein